MTIDDKLRELLKAKGVDFVHFVDISSLPVHLNKGYPNAILFGMMLSGSYLKMVTNTPNYVQEMIRNEQTKLDEFHIKEQTTDAIADYLACYLEAKGYSAYSQSEENIGVTGFYDYENNSTPLPHKTIAGMAGLGWIGKSNLMVTHEYGSAISMCTVLTNAPLIAGSFDVIPVHCGECSICVDACEVQAIKGNAWHAGIDRNTLVDVSLCNTCIKCMVLCPWTQKYIKSASVLHP